MSLRIAELRYACDALEPRLSEETVRCHHTEIAHTFVSNVNAIICGTELEFRPLEDILQLASGKLLANAAEAWSHAFYWNCLTPDGSSEPKGPFSDVINQQFGTPNRLKRQFTDAAVSLLGAGWVWLVKDINGELDVLSTKDHNTGTLLREAVTPILTCDVWEHAYYLDYRGSRRQYLEAYWHLVNWDFVARQYQLDPRQLCT